MRQFSNVTGLSPIRVHQLLGSVDEESKDKDADAQAHPAPEATGGAGAATEALERARGAGVLAGLAGPAAVRPGLTSGWSGSTR